MSICANHPEVQAAAFCRTCGKPLCEACERSAMGTIFCEEHLPVQPTGAPPPYENPAGVSGAGQPYSPYTTPYTAPYPAERAGASPGLAFILGLIPGVGAIYNGQYAKGLVHVIVLGLLISIVSSNAAGDLAPLFGLLIGLWFFYMAFEAYHTASKRQKGEIVDEFSSIVPMQNHTSGFPVVPILLIVIGIVFLLVNLDLVRLYQVLRYWPVFLIALGVYLLYARVARPAEVPPTASSPEVTRER